MKRSSLLLAAAPAVLVLGCKPAELEYHQVEFPGFSLEVPKSVKYAAAPTAEEYRTGTSDSSGMFHMVNISWQVGAIASEQDMPVFIESMRALVPAGANLRSDPPRSIMVGTHRAVRIDARADGMELAFVDVECGKRSVMIAMGAARNFDAMQKRVLASFDCHPIAAQEASVAGAAVIGVADPTIFDGWTRSDEGDGVFSIQKDSLVLVAVQIPKFDADETAMVSKMLPAMFGNEGMTWKPTRKERRGLRTFQHGAITGEDLDVSGAVAVWNCAGRSDGVMVLLMHALGEDLTPHLSLVDQIRCAAAGDPPLNVPAAAPE